MFRNPKNSSSCLDESVDTGGNICCKRLVIVVGAVLLMSPLLASLSQASDVPFRITYTGTLLDTNFNVAPDLESPFPLPLYADVVNGQSHGTFGPSMTTILTEFRPYVMGDPTPPADCVGTVYLYLIVAYSKGVVTFANGDQLVVTAEDGGGYVCLNLATGYYTGEANGDFDGGTGRFENASGSWESPFSGRNLTVGELGFGFGPIQGTVDGMLDMY
jgi:hypothetical protein